jgi:hypothetical protein
VATFSSKNAEKVQLNVFFSPLPPAGLLHADAPKNHFFATPLFLFPPLSMVIIAFLFCSFHAALY